MLHSTLVLKMSKLGECMKKPKRIKISLIENKILNVNCKLSRIESISKILYECLTDNCNIDVRDTQSLSSLLYDEIRRTKIKLNKIETLLF